MEEALSRAAVRWGSAARSIVPCIGRLLIFPSMIGSGRRLLTELHPVARARARASLLHSAASERQSADAPSQRLRPVTSLFPKHKAVRELSRTICPEAARP